jgi:cell division protein FtsQ
MKRRIALLVSAVLIIAAAYILGWSSFFTVSSVEIQGSTTQLDSGITKGEKLARVEPRAVAAKFENLDWVLSASVSRNWFNGKVVIDLVERTPIAIYKKKAFDVNGKSFRFHSAIPAKLVQIQAPDTAAASRAVSFFTELPDDLKSKLTVVKFQSGGAFILNIKKSGKKLEIRWGSNGENALKLKVYKALIALPENAHIKHIDVSAPHAPIVK